MDVGGDMLQISNKVSIPRSELRFRFSRSGGPGGQHVQKSSTRVELLFDVAHSPSLSDEERLRVLERLSSHIDSTGTLRLVARSERSQWQNREEAIERFQTLMRKALRRRKKRRATRPTAAARERRLRHKRNRSLTKRLRHKVHADE
jgi:ribosome-associated protein